MATKCDIIEISESETESSELELELDKEAVVEISSPTSSDDNDKECDYEDGDDYSDDDCDYDDDDDDSDYVDGDDEGDYEDDGSKDRDSDYDGYGLKVSENKQERDIHVDINDEEFVCHKVVQFIQGKCSLKMLKLVECKVFLRKHGLKISGTKAECVERIKEFWNSPRRSESKEEADIHVDVNDEEFACKEVIQFIQGKCSIKSVKLVECKVFLRKHSLRVSGTKEECAERIKEFWRLKNGKGEAFYPRSSFTINCTGDVCKGDIVMFSQKVHQTSDKIKGDGNDMGRRTVAGRIVKESYGATKQQHTFTVEVFWSRGTKKLAPLFPLLVKGRKLYKFKTFRQPWTNEKERSEVLAEKHQRGAVARAVRAMRKLKIAKRTDKPKPSRGVLNQNPLPSLDVYFGEREEHRMAKQVAMVALQEMSGPVNVAYAAQRIQCYHCKELGHISRNCDKKSCNYCKNSGHLIKECPTRPENRHIQAFHDGTSANAPSQTTTINNRTCQQQSYSQISLNQKFCNYCKKNGHLILECPTRPENRHFQAFHDVGPFAHAPSYTNFQQQLCSHIARDRDQKICTYHKTTARNNHSSYQQQSYRSYTGNGFYQER